MQLLFQTASIGFVAWCQIALFGSGLFTLVELEKAILHRARIRA